MVDKKYLYEELILKAFYSGISKPTIPAYVTENLKYSLWDWQQKALENFLIQEEINKKEGENGPTHLMFNMATGTGKTLLMAALILYYYKKGYNHFIFFVNQNNIVDKTENNFINKIHIKYLFRKNIIIDDKIVNIRKVETFDSSDNIQIKFTSIHKLHNAVYLARENFVTLQDLQKRNLVMIGDEAHHFNAATLIKNKQKELPIETEIEENAPDSIKEKICWENTVLNKILRKGKNNQNVDNRNVLLEFTATIPKDDDVIEKYRTKTIFKYELVDFLNAGYTKEINLISTSLSKKEKILLALLFNWYRHQIALKNGLLNFKPVILFRSKFIDESKKDYAGFVSLNKDLDANDFKFLDNIEVILKQDQSSSSVYEQGKSRMIQMLKFIKDEKINITDIVNYIKDAFAERNCIITNSEDKRAIGQRGGEKTTDEQNDLLNNLEDKNNHIRAIFTVKRLTEGWDVLNLFDIVRLYAGGRDEYEDKKTGERKAGEATIQEIQLIGRGVRYCPFQYNGYELNRRKFDNDLENPLRVLEELYYHSENNHRYLDELKRELKNRGFIQDNRFIKRFALKDEFKQSDFYRKTKIWKNKQIDNSDRKRKTLLELEKEFLLEYTTREFSLREQQIILDDNKDKVLVESIKGNRKTIDVKLKDFEKHLIIKAINKKATKDLSLLRFDNLKNELSIESINDLFSSHFLGNFKIKIITTSGKNDLKDISHEEQLNLLLDFFDLFVNKLKEIVHPYKGSDKFDSFSFAEIFGAPKEKSILINEQSRQLEMELLNHKWYVLNGFNGTDEERHLVDFLKNKIGNLKERYDEVYLLRNEEVYKIYDFEQGRGFEPDFLLFLKGKKENLYYQIFIEPKGEQFTDKEGKFKDSREGWKEKFLEEILTRHGKKNIFSFENIDYKLIGLPLFNSNDKKAFEEIFNSHLLA